MDGRNYNYIPPNALNLHQNLNPPPHFITRDRTTTAVRHRELEPLLFENHRLTEQHFLLSQQLSAARQELRHLSAAAVKVKAERDAETREVYDKAVKMEAEVKLVGESTAKLVETLCELRKLRSEKEELDEKLKKVRDDVDNVSDEWKQVPVVKSEIEAMQKEIQRGREVIEHEKRVHASNIKQSEAMENYKILMADEIKKLQVEVIDAGKRARAAAAAEAGPRST
ncbi:hypothetical protein Hdeb2414_s0007g00233411 [Helianthus debilis subsp. tardiflorus]